MKKVKVRYGKVDIEGLLLEDREHKFIIVQKGGSIELHFPKKDYTYTVVEDK